MQLLLRLRLRLLLRGVFLGVGIGHRMELDAAIRAWSSSIDCLELITEHYVKAPSERTRRALALANEFPLLPHGVEMSIGTAGGLDRGYLDGFAEFVEAVDAPWFSDHLSFTRAGGIALGNLTPLLRTRENAEDVARKAQQVQEHVGIPFLLENITYYVDINAELTEAQFISEVMERCDCGLLLDVTNVFINATNHRFDAGKFLDSIPLERAVQMHLAGGEWSGDTLLDMHGAPVHPEVWDLLESIVSRTPQLRAVTIERDQNYPEDFAELAADLDHAREIVSRARAG